MICVCVASVSAEAFINFFSAPLVPIAPIATQFSPSPLGLSIVTPPVHDLSLRKVYQFRASIDPNTNLVVPVLPPNVHEFSVNSFEKQQELHQRILPIPQLIRAPSDIVLRSDIIDGVQTIQTARESFQFNHGVQPQELHYQHPQHQAHHEHHFNHHSRHYEPRGFKTYGLPQHEELAPVYNVPSVQQPQFETAPIQSIPAPTTINLPTEIQSIPEDIDYTVATNPEFTLPIETLQPIVPIESINQPATIDEYEVPHHAQPSIQPILTLTPPLATPIDAIPIQPAPHSPAIFAPSATQSPPLIRNIADSSLPAVPTAPASRIESGDENLFQSEYSLPDGTKVSDNGQIIETNIPGWEKVIARSGMYEFITPEGIKIKTKWVADHNGFRIIPN